MKTLICTLMLWAGSALAADDGSELPRVLLDTTKGEIVLELYPSRAPETVANFLRLVDQGFYAGLIFHRVVAGFVVQAGGYDEKLTHREPPRSVVNESANGLSNGLGTVAMARMSDPDSADTQFYINLRANPSLDAAAGRPGYTVFGRVVEGMTSVKLIEESPTQLAGGMQDVPVEAVVIRSAKRL
jgi:cyclophilin family peptidyl-prolyl cis-trans isomerase